MKINLKQRRGITLIALVITIVVLLILAGVTIAMLTGENGILGKATTAKSKNDEASVEEKIKLSVMYARMNTNGDTNINLDELEKELEKNFDNVSISKKGANEALPWVVTSNGYMFEITENGEVKKVNGIALDKSNIKLLQDGTETITAELTQGVTGTITWTSEDSSIAEVNSSGNVTAVSSGETTITAKIEGTDYSATCKVNVVSKVKSISVDNFEIGVEEEKEIKIKTTPSDNVEELTYTYSVDNSNVTVDNSGKAKGIKIGTSTIIIKGTGKLSKEEVTTQCEVEVTKQLVSVTAQEIAENPKAYYGKKVENYKVSEEDTNTYRIFYVNKTANEFGDEAYTIYLKVDSAGYEYLEKYESYDKVNTKIKVMNPKWANGITSDSDVTTRGNSESNWKINEKAAAYLCSPVDANNYNNTSLPWKTYYKQNDGNVNYVIGGPSVEMYVKSYNNAYNGIINDTSRYPLGTNYSKTAVNGYVYTINNNQTSDYSTGNIIDYTNYNGMYCRSYIDFWWLASPSARDESAVCCVQSLSDTEHTKQLASPEIISTASCLSPIISLKSSFQPLVER